MALCPSSFLQEPGNETSRPFVDQLQVKSLAVCDLHGFCTSPFPSLSPFFSSSPLSSLPPLASLPKDMYYDHHQADSDKRKEDGTRNQPKQSKHQQQSHSHVGVAGGLGMGQCDLRC